jgi:hypothetical protein
MKKIIFIILFSLISFLVYAKDQGCSNKEMNPAVQLQDNGWLKIVDQYIEEFTPEEFYNGDEKAIKSHKESVKLLEYKTEKIRTLHVKIQFLKPCVATTETDEYFKDHPGKDPNDIIPLTGEKGECLALLIGSIDAERQGNKKKSDEILKKAAKQCHNIMDYLQPRFRCDYRFKVFNTTFTPSKFKKYTSDVDSDFPEAPTIDIKGNRIYRKNEILPGETIWITFPISGNVTSWCVWVPK